MHTKKCEYNPHNVRRQLQRKDAKNLIAQQKENIKILEKEVKAAQRAGTKRAQGQLQNDSDYEAQGNAREKGRKLM